MHPTYKRNWIGFQTLFTKEWIRIIRIWSQTLLPPAITMVLYFLIFGSLLGQQIGPIHGFTYIQFIAPGLIMMSIITNAYANVVASFFGARFQKNIEEMLTSPMPDSLILMGYVMGGVIRGLVVGLIITGIALFFTHLHLTHFAIILCIATLSASLFSLAGFMNGLFAKKFDDISIIPTFILTPLSYLGGVFYSIDMLPPFWQHLSLANPIVYIVSAFRYSMLGTSYIGIFYSFSIIFITNVLLFFINLYLMKKCSGLRT